MCVCAALLKIASIVDDINKLCANDALRGEASESLKKLTTCAEMAKEKLTKEFSEMKEKRAALEAEIKDVLVQNKLM